MLRRPSATSGLGPLTAPYKQLVRAKPTKASTGDHARVRPSRVRPSPGSAWRAHTLPTPGRPKGFQRRRPPGQRLPTTTPRLGGSDAPNVLCVSALGRLVELCPRTPCSALRPPGLPSTIKTAALETNQQACGLHAEYTQRTPIPPVFPEHLLHTRHRLGVGCVVTTGKAPGQGSHSSGKKQKNRRLTPNGRSWGWGREEGIRDHDS